MGVAANLFRTQGIRESCYSIHILLRLMPLNSSLDRHKTSYYSCGSKPEKPICNLLEYGKAMKTFEVYKHPKLGYQAVKQGFSWPAFFFTVIWALVKRMWGNGGLLLGVFFLLFLGKAAFGAEGGELGVLLMNLLIVALCIFVGFKGNDWWRNDLSRRGFSKLQSVQAGTPDAAIGEVAQLDEDSRTETP